jgi:hypothetical protein
VEGPRPVSPLLDEAEPVGDLYVLRAPQLEGYAAQEFAAKVSARWREEYAGPDRQRRLLVLTGGAELSIVRPPSQLAAWAYQYVGALSVRYQFREGDLGPLLDVLSALANGTDAAVSWPAELPDEADA